MYEYLVYKFFGKKEDKMERSHLLLLKSFIEIAYMYVELSKVMYV